MAERKQIDWEAIEREYRAGQLSIREIARQYDVTDTAIRKKAKVKSWVQDLTAQVQEKVRSELVRSEFAAEKAPPSEIIKAAAERGVEVVRQHRKSLDKLQVISRRLTEKAQTILEDATDIKSLNDATSVVESLSRTLARVIPLERQAFNLDEKGAGSPDNPLGVVIVPAKGKDD